jgi:hypothetical protein
MGLHAIVLLMADQEAWETLSQLAEEQAGYITTAQAEAIGVHRKPFATRDVFEW